VVEDLSALAVKPFTAPALASARARLLRLAQADEERKERQRAKNNLETLIYKVRDRTTDDSESFESVTNEEQRSSLRDLLDDARDWLDEDGEDAGSTDVTEYTTRHSGIETIANAAWKRLSEKKGRPGALGKAKETIATMRELVATWAEKKPWISALQSELAEEAISGLEKWIERKVEEQEGKEVFEEPAFTIRQLRTEVGIASKTILRTDKTPKPTPTPSPSPSNETEGAEAEAGEG